MCTALREAALLTLAAVVLAALYWQFGATDLPWIRNTPTLSYAADTLGAEDFSLPEVSVVDSAAAPRYVTMKHAAELHHERAAVFIDAREHERFAAGHIDGALHVSYYTPESWEQNLQNLPRETRLIVYCDNDCDSARRLAEAMLVLGYKNILVLDKGFDSWRAAGYPVAQ